jgi:response regulator RpfG family c-di-GMP phosphodiesterase
MPNMSGSEFLEATIELVPEAIRVIITAHTQSENIIKAVNQAKAYMFLTKPFDNLELVQIVKNCFKAYWSNLEKIKLTNELKIRNEKLNNAIKDFQEITNTIIPTLLKLTSESEKGYFTNHTQAVVDIGLSLLDSMDLRNTRSYWIVISSILLNNIMNNIPEKYVGIDPNLLDKLEQKEYFINFNKQIDRLLEIEPIRRFALTCTQIWEHFDGSGIPVGISGNAFNKEAQILSLANYYHNLVYLIPKEQFLNREELAEFEQTPEQTKRRHSEAIQFLFKNSYWYDNELMNRFKDLIRSKKCLSLVPDTNIYRVICFGDNIKTLKISPKDIKNYQDKKLLVPVERFLKEQKKEKKKDTLQTRLPISEIRAGMITDEDIVTKFGRLIVIKGTLLNQDHLDELKRLIADGLLAGEVSVLVPREL